MSLSSFAEWTYEYPRYMIFHPHYRPRLTTHFNTELRLHLRELLRHTLSCPYHRPSNKFGTWNGYRDCAIIAIINKTPKNDLLLLVHSTSLETTLAIAVKSCLKSPYLVFRNSVLIALRVPIKMHSYSAVECCGSSQN